MSSVVGLFVLAAGDVGSHYLDESSHCGTFYGSNTESRALQGRAMWNEARSLLGLPALGEERIPPEFFSPPAYITMCSNTSLYKHRQKTLAYKDVWKAGNNFFRGTLERSGQSCSDRDNDHSHNTEPMHGQLLFSFVRDPFARFVSGYREVAYRILTQHCADGNGTALNAAGGKTSNLTCSDLHPENGRLQYAAEQLLYLWLGGTTTQDKHHDDLCSTGSCQFKHLALMSGWLYGAPPYPRFLGRLECLPDDWVRLCATGSCPDSIQNYSAPTHQHPTSSDPFGHGAALLAFFEHDARPWRKAIELLYKLDRDCFGLGPGWSADHCATTPPPRPLKSPHTDN